MRRKDEPFLIPCKRCGQKAEIVEADRRLCQVCSTIEADRRLLEKRELKKDELKEARKLAEYWRDYAYLTVTALDKKNKLKHSALPWE